MACAAEKDQAKRPKEERGSRERSSHVAGEKDKGVCFWRVEPRKIKSRGPRKKVAGEKDNVTWQPCKIKGFVFVCRAEKDPVKRQKEEGAGKVGGHFNKTMVIIGEISLR